MAIADTPVDPPANMQRWVAEVNKEITRLADENRRLASRVRALEGRQ